jgi:hypothetical protein
MSIQYTNGNFTNLNFEEIKKKRNLLKNFFLTEYGLPEIEAQEGHDNSLNSKDTIYKWSTEKMNITIGTALSLGDSNSMIRSKDYLNQIKKNKRFNN